MDRDKLIVALKAEALAFAGLCRAAVRFAVKKVRKEDVSAERAEISDLQKRSWRLQVAIAALLAIGLMLRGCGISGHRGVGIVHADAEKVREVKRQMTERAEKAQDRLAADALKHLVVDIPLHLMVVPAEGAPVRGGVYQNNMGNAMRIFQALQGGVLVERMDNASASIPLRRLYIKTDRSYVDGDFLAEGYYEEDGVFRYVTTGGAQTSVYCFRELPEAIVRRMTAIQAGRRAESTETVAPAARQKQAMASIEKALSEIAFGKVEENIVIQKSLRSKLTLEYDRAFVTRLAEMQSKRDWKGLLDIARKWKRADNFKDSLVRMASNPVVAEMEQLVQVLKNLPVSFRILKKDRNLSLQADCWSSGSERYVWINASGRGNAHCRFNDEGNLVEGAWPVFSEKIYIRSEADFNIGEDLKKEHEESAAAAYRREVGVSMLSDEEKAERYRMHMHKARQSYLKAYSDWYETH